MRFIKGIYTMATGGLISLLLTWLLAESADVSTPLLVALGVWLVALALKAYFVLQVPRTQTSEAVR